MVDISISTYNKLVINYDTYEFTPSNYSQILIDNPWYIDTSSAPDFMKFNSKETNGMKITMPEDVYSIKDYQCYPGLDKNSTSNSVKVITYEKIDHVTMVNKYLTTMGARTDTRELLDYYLYYDHTRSGWCSGYPTGYTPTKVQAILCPVMQKKSYSYFGGQMFPLIKTITLTIQSTKLQMYVPQHTITYDSNNGSGTYDVTEGIYTYSSYCNLLLSKINKSLPGFTGVEYIPYYNHMPMARFVNGIWIIWNGDVVKSLFGKLHGIPITTSANGHGIVTGANNRCMTISSGDWNLADFMDHVNTSSHGFALTSDEHYIYIQYVNENTNLPFIINPACNIIDDVTDTSETYSTKKILCAHPQFKLLNCTVKFKGTSYTCKERLTPAEFLRWIYNKTKATCRVVNNVITCLDNIDKLNLTVSDNPFFEFKEFGIVVNKCGMKTCKYSVGINNYNALNIGVNYNTSFNVYNYSSVNINNNITTSLNNNVKIIN